ncbi:MAG: hypothetical protein IH611_09150 [Deltaproteobacteria bacterium]|nr:hypothetical protein [Deltaproteobacteria bacterium]
MLKLYHFTSVRHMRDIMRSGCIRTTCSDIQPDGAGPAVVWLTSNPNPKQEWTEGDAPVFLLEKYGIRITVEIPEKDAHRYPEWSGKMGMDPKWFKLYTERDGDFGNWYVVTRPIGKAEWKAVEMWEGFQSNQTKGYSQGMYESFNAFLSGTEVQAWILEAMNRDIDPGDGVPPVTVEEWLKMRGTRKEGAKKTEMLLGGMRNAGGGKHEKKH